MFERQSASMTRAMAALVSVGVILASLENSACAADEATSPAPTSPTAVTDPALHREGAQEIATRCAVIRRDAASGESSPDLQRWLQACDRLRIEGSPAR